MEDDENTDCSTVLHCKLNLARTSELGSPKEEGGKLNEEVSYKGCHSFFHLKMQTLIALHSSHEWKFIFRYFQKDPSLIG